jgi:molecular chaperone GrpE
MNTHNKQSENDDIILTEEEKELSSFTKKSATALKKELSACKKQASEYLAGWQRAKADLINYRKGDEARRKDAVRYATEDFIAQCIPILDSFDMAFRDRNTWEQAPENWRRGIEHIYAQFLSVLRDNGVSQLTPLNEPFDPSQHDSAGTNPVDTKKDDGIILDVIQRGYTLHDKLIRAPKVIVGHYQE